MCTDRLDPSQIQNELSLGELRAYCTRNDPDKQSDTLQRMQMKVGELPLHWA